MKLSIIIPIYNAQDYLAQCIDSVISQEFHDFEVILVDDGSTDKSGILADDYSKKHSNVSVIHQKNGGLSSARNAGLDSCSGDYVIFLDSDDYLAEQSLKTISDEIENSTPDIIAGYRKFFSKDGVKDGCSFRDGLEEPVPGKEFFTKAFYQKRFTVGAQYYVYNRNFLERNNFRFRQGILHEDELWTPIVIYNAATVSDLKFHFYFNRCDNVTSITRDPAKKQRRARDRKTVAEELADYFSDKNGSDTNAFHDNICAHYMYAVFSGDMVKDKNISRIFPFHEARTIKYKLKSILFYISPVLACKMRKLFGD